MSRSTYFDSTFNSYYLPTGSYGPRPALANVDITAADLADAIHGNNVADYRAGKRLWYIPVVPGSTAGVSAKHGADGDPIWGVVMGASDLTPNSGQGYGATTKNAINQYQSGNPETLAILFRGCGAVLVFKYTGTAPAATGTAAATHVVCAGSGAVKIAPDEATAQSFGVRVLAVDTVRRLVAVIL